MTAAPPHHRRDRSARAVEAIRWLGEDTARMVRSWRPPERPDIEEQPKAERRPRVAEPTWGRSPLATAARRAVQDRALFPLLTALGRPEVAGTHHLLEVRPPYILAPNHASHADAPLVLQALPASIRAQTVVPAAADYFFDRRLLRVAVTLAMNAVPFDRKNEIADSVRRCERFLRHGHSVVLFPEGTRSLDGRLRGFKAGVSHLAVQTGAPVIPVFVQGTHGLMPRGRALPRPRQVAVHFGAALVAAPQESARPFNARLEEAVLALAAGARDFAHRDRSPRVASWREQWRRGAGSGLESERDAQARLLGGVDDPDVLHPREVVHAGGGWIERWRQTTPR